MEFLIELLLDLVLEGSVEISSNRKIPKSIRWPFIVLIVLFFFVVIFGMFVLGMLILNKSLLGGVFIIVVNCIFIILGIKKFKKVYLEHK